MKTSRYRNPKTPFIDNTLEGVNILCTSSPVDEFAFNETIMPDGSIALSYSDPIYLLFNQQRLDKNGSFAIQQWLQSLQSSLSSQLSQLRSKCSDEDLISMIKSRHIQSPSELKSWLDYCSSNIEQFNSELALLQQEQENINPEPIKTE